MALGQRIKQARLEAGLSQRQLCGDTITRNMLSLIESGRARPGMDTLQVLAARLGKPVGWLLEETEVLPAQEAAMDRARQAYIAGAFRQAVRELEGTAGEEGALLRYLGLMALAEQALKEEKTLYARELLDQAESGAGMYDCYALQVYRLFLQARAGNRQAAKALGQVTDELLLLRAESLAPEQAAKALDAVVSRDEMWYYRRGRAALEMGQYPQAAEYLHRAEKAMEETCAPLLEVCYREMGDYKMAYAYACRQKDKA